jgi:hypothetical protein
MSITLGAANQSPRPDPKPLTKNQLAKLFLSDDKALIAQGNVVKVEMFGDLHQTRWTIQSDGLFPEKQFLYSRVLILLVEE